MKPSDRTPEANARQAGRPPETSEEAIFFETPAELRAWLEEHHATAPELWVGYYKKASGRRSLTWSDVVDEALCFGWIDGKGAGDRRAPLPAGAHSPPAEQQLERRQHREGRRAPRAGAHDSSRRGGVFRPAGGPVRRLLVRAAPRVVVRRRSGSGVPRERPRVGVVLCAVAFVSHDGDVLGRQRQAPRDARATARDIDRMLVRAAARPPAVDVGHRLGSLKVDRPRGLDTASPRGRSTT